MFLASVAFAMAMSKAQSGIERAIKKLRHKERESSHGVFPLRVAQLNLASEYCFPDWRKRLEGVISVVAKFQEKKQPLHVLATCESGFNQTTTMVDEMKKMGYTYYGWSTGKLHLDDNKQPVLDEEGNPIEPFHQPVHKLKATDFVGEMVGLYVHQSLLSSGCSSSPECVREKPWGEAAEQGEMEQDDGAKDEAKDETAKKEQKEEVGYEVLPPGPRHKRLFTYWISDTLKLAFVAFHLDHISKKQRDSSCAQFQKFAATLKARGISVIFLGDLNTYPDVEGPVSEDVLLDKGFVVASHEGERLGKHRGQTGTYVGFVPKGKEKADPTDFKCHLLSKRVKLGDGIEEGSGEIRGWRRVFYIGSAALDVVMYPESDFVLEESAHCYIAGGNLELYMKDREALEKRKDLSSDHLFTMAVLTRK